MTRPHRRSRTRVRSGTHRPSPRLRVEVCEACGQVLAQATACTADPYPTAARWGREPYWHEENLEPADNCPDCWTSLDQPHHHDCIRAWCLPCDDCVYMCHHAGTDEAA